MDKKTKVLWFLSNQHGTAVGPDRGLWREAAQDAVDMGLAQWHGVPGGALCWLNIVGLGQPHHIDRRKESADDA